MACVRTDSTDATDAALRAGWPRRAEAAGAALFRAGNRRAVAQTRPV
jgi:hypothetical protein